ncbi:MAG: SDR family NAD(P)-dependent oxidoreductase [Actinomycetota bacterium]|nr:SDR family NAD(P)-dependent oxidoreductase [Actinomycetota bacterium]
MLELRGKTAVVTGAASGIGRAMAMRFGREGMNVVLADVEAGPLEEATGACRDLGVEAIGIECDVSDAGSVDNLAKAALAAFDRVNVVCNNAGVAAANVDADGVLDLDTWRWIIDVNLWGVVHGHAAFLPHLLSHGDGHIVNTASMAGHFASFDAYSASKFAVVGLTEGLYHRLAADGSTVGVSCLCPGWVDTRIADADRNRPGGALPGPALVGVDEAASERVREQLRSGERPDQVADLVLDAVRERRFWVFTDDAMVQGLEDRHRSIAQHRNPVPRPYRG